MTYEDAHLHVQAGQQIHSSLCGLSAAKDVKNTQLPKVGDFTSRHGVTFQKTGLSSVKNALSSCLKVRWIPCLRYMASLVVVGGWRRSLRHTIRNSFPVRNCSGGSDGTPTATYVVEMPATVRQGWPTLGP